MEPVLVLITIVLFALMLAAVAGFLAARVLMHAAEARPTPGGQTHDR